MLLLKLKLGKGRGDEGRQGVRTGGERRGGGDRCGEEDFIFFI